jgi:hypothetical protein
MKNQVRSSEITGRVSIRFLTAPVRWRFGIAGLAVEKRQRAAAVQDADAIKEAKPC